MNENLFKKSFSAFLFLWTWCSYNLDNNVQAADELTKSTWADLDIASKVAGHVAYRHFHLDIYEMKKSNETHWEGGRKQYVYTPVLDLDHQFARCEYNNVTDVSPTVRSEDVTVIPFNKVMLSSK